MSCVGKDPRKSMTLRSQIIHFLAQVGALIDFGEREDIEKGVYEQSITVTTN